MQGGLDGLRILRSIANAIQDQFLVHGAGIGDAADV